MEIQRKLPLSFAEQCKDCDNTIAAAAAAAASLCTAVQHSSGSSLTARQLNSAPSNTSTFPSS
jgi:hypothetical protein